jgi:hypothetical protein
MKRLALALATTLLASGCIYLTPPTGLRIGSHENEFPASSGIGAQSIAMSQYKAPDFQVIFPDIWQAIPPQDLVSQRDGKTIRRVSIGQVASNGDAEGLQVTNLLAALDADPAKNLTALGTSVQASLKAGVKDDFKLVDNSPTTMDGEPALRIEVQGTALDEVDPSTGQAFPGKGQHYLAYCCWHKGRAYILVISTLEARWDQLSQLFEGMAKEWRFADGAAPTVCTATPAATASADAGATRDAAASAGAKADATATADAGATAQAGASAAASPRVVYTICKPDAGATGAARPSASPSAGPAK